MARAPAVAAGGPIGRSSIALVLAILACALAVRIANSAAASAIARDGVGGRASRVSAGVSSVTVMLDVSPAPAVPLASAPAGPATSLESPPNVNDLDSDADAVAEARLQELLRRPLLNCSAAWAATLAEYGTWHAAARSALLDGDAVVPKVVVYSCRETAGAVHNCGGYADRLAGSVRGRRSEVTGSGYCGGTQLLCRSAEAPLARHVPPLADTCLPARAH